MCGGQMGVPSLSRQNQAPRPRTASGWPPPSQDWAPGGGDAGHWSLIPAHRGGWGPVCTVDHPIPFMWLEGPKI